MMHTFWCSHSCLSGLVQGASYGIIGHATACCSRKDSAACPPHALCRALSTWIQMLCRSAPVRCSFADSTDSLSSSISMVPPDYELAETLPKGKVHSSIAALPCKCASPAASMSESIRLMAACLPALVAPAPAPPLPASGCADALGRLGPPESSVLLSRANSVPRW